MNNEQLNNLVVSYQSERLDDQFVLIYEMVTKNWRNLKTVAKSVRASEAEMLALYEDELLKCIEVYDSRGDFINLLNRYIWRKRRRVYSKKNTLYKYEVYEIDREDDEAANFEIADEFNLEEQIIAKKKADQRQLIDSLLNDADETTTAIVATFLAHPKPTATAIAKELGVHHSKVTRALNRLAGKFSTKQFGDYHDYLVAL
jgi:hypothetical protein